MFKMLSNVAFFVPFLPVSNKVFSILHSWFILKLSLGEITACKPLCSQLSFSILVKPCKSN